MRKCSTILLLLISVAAARSQNNTVPGGGQATGSNGSASFTIGQIAYSSISGAGASVIQGIQQPFEVSLITSARDITPLSDITVYPNPTTDQLLVNIGSQDRKQLYYEIIDIKGKALLRQRINQQQSLLDFTGYPNGIYILKIISKEKQVQTFKIIKNK